MVNTEITFRTAVTTGTVLYLGSPCGYVQATAETNSIWVGVFYAPPGSVFSPPVDPTPTAGSVANGWTLVPAGGTYTYDVSKGSNSPGDVVNYIQIYCATAGGYLAVNAR